MKTSTKSISSKFSFPSLTTYFSKLTAVAAVITAIVGSTFSTANAQDAHPGEAIFKKTCVACHGATGAGIPGVFPPLAESEWVNGPEENLVRIQLRGLMGPITVKGKQYSSAMPPNATMSDQEIADVLTYVRSNMGNKAPAITPETVKAIRAKEAGNSAMLTVKDLKSPVAAEANPEVKPVVKPAPVPAPEAKPVPAEPEVKPIPEAKPEPKPAEPEAPAVAEGGHPGQAIFKKTCVACHGANGEGMGAIFPPLAGSEWVNGPAENLIKIQLRGLSGPIEVKGMPYNSMMPPNATMSDQEIADVLTYVRSSMGNAASAVTADMVKEHRAEAKANPAPMTVKDLIDPTVKTATLTEATELEGFKPAASNGSGSVLFWALGIIGVCTLPAIVGFAKN